MPCLFSNTMFVHISILFRTSKVRLMLQKTRLSVRDFFRKNLLFLTNYFLLVFLMYFLLRPIIGKSFFAPARALLKDKSSSYT